MGNGSEKVAHAFRLKYQDLKSAARRLPKSAFTCDVYFQFEFMMIELARLTGWKGFVQSLQDAAALQDLRTRSSEWEFAWFLHVGNDVFGKKRVQAYLEKATQANPTSRSLSLALKSCRDESIAVARGAEAELTCDLYIEKAHAVDEERFGNRSMIGLAGRYARQASKEDLARIAERIAVEKDVRVRNRLLCIFSFVDYPGDVGFLLVATKERDDPYGFKLPQAISRIKDVRVHDFAIAQIESGDPQLGYELLVKNWRISDERVIRRQLARRPKVTHLMQQSIRDVYLSHRSKTCGSILEYVYRRGECGFCRSGIVEAMISNRVATDEILNECLYDSFDETRRRAARKLTSRMNHEG
jgi:hypothetical protein